MLKSSFLNHIYMTQRSTVSPVKQSKSSKVSLPTVQKKKSKRSQLKPVWRQMTLVNLCDRPVQAVVLDFNPHLTNKSSLDREGLSYSSYRPRVSRCRAVYDDDQVSHNKILFAPVHFWHSYSWVKYSLIHFLQNKSDIYWTCFHLLCA